MCALSPLVFITTLQGHLGISQGSRSTFAESMERRSGSVTSAPRSMLFNLIGKLTPKPVVQESIDVTVEPFSPGESSCVKELILSFFFHEFGRR